MVIGGEFGLLSSWGKRRTRLFRRLSPASLPPSFPPPPPKDYWRYISIHKLSFFAAHCSGKVKKWVGEEIGYKTLSDWKPDVVTPEKCVAKAEKVLVCY